MSGDLISRSALLEDIRNNITEMSGTMDWLKLIDRHPTAYNVDKVVEQLEEAKSNYNGESAEFWTYREAIRIVKAGGVE